MLETAFVSSGIGGGFMNTSKLHVMKFKEGMAGEDYVKWQKAVER
jgi:hypothetical protein